MFVGAGLIFGPFFFCLKTSARIGGFFPHLKRWKRNQAILLRRISGGRITATGRKTNGMKYATKEPRMGFFWVGWEVMRKAGTLIQKPTVGWVCYGCGWPLFRGWKSYPEIFGFFHKPSNQGSLLTNYILTWNVTKVFIAGQIRHLWQRLRQTWCLHVAVVIGRLISPHLFWRLRYCYCLPGV